jgi:hypothetical protein
MNSQFIEVGIGLVFVFLLMAVMVSAVNEMAMSVFSQRGKFMKKAVRDALDDPFNKHWSQLVYDHPLIDRLKRSERRPPAYISSSTFAMALIEVISNEARVDHFHVQGDETFYVDKTPETSPFLQFKAGLATLKESHVKNVLQSFVNDSNGDYVKLKENIERWFNEYMDRVGGWYKRKMKRSIFLFSCILTLIMNVDTVELSVRLWDNAVLRETLVSAAEVYVEENKAKYQEKQTLSPADANAMAAIRKDTSLTEKERTEMLAAYGAPADTIGFDDHMEEIEGAYEQVGMLNLPIGWGAQKDSVLYYERYHDSVIAEIDTGKFYQSFSRFEKWWLKTREKVHFYSDIMDIYTDDISLLKILGWFFTAMAVSYGAPFWFDLLNKLVNLRGNGKAAPN